MKRRERIRPLAIACFAVALAVAGFMWTFAPRRASHLGLAEARAWIPLPRTGMDARDAAVRAVLGMSRGFPGDDPMDPPLADTCGRYADTSTDARYRLTIGDGFFNPPFRTWRIDIVVRDGQAVIGVRDAGVPPPPPSPGDSQVYAMQRWATPARHLSVPIARLDAIRAAWNSEEAWHAAQGAASCTDGRTSLLEACVDGRYAARDRHCEPNRKIDALWQAVLRSVPAPEPGRLEPAPR